MKKQYIKFIEWDKKDLQRACKLAERYWYVKHLHNNALKFEWEWILECLDMYYHTSTDSEVKLKSMWYTELKENIYWKTLFDLYNESYKNIINPFKTWFKIPYVKNINSKRMNAIFPEYTPKYFVITEWKSAPTKIHNSLWWAKYEAKRLAKLENRNTYVVEIKHKYWTEIKELTI